MLLISVRQLYKSRPCLFQLLIKLHRLTSVTGRYYGLSLLCLAIKSIRKKHNDADVSRKICSCLNLHLRRNNCVKFSPNTYLSQNQSQTVTNSHKQSQIVNMYLFIKFIRLFEELDIKPVPHFLYNLDPRVQFLLRPFQQVHQTFVLRHARC